MGEGDGGGGTAMARREALLAAGVLGVLLALGLFLGGMQLTEAVKAWKQADRVVSVKGLAERDVKVDLVLWPLSYSVAADSLDELHTGLRAAEGKIRDFLLARGFTEAEISTTAPQVVDRWEHVYGETRPLYRYTGESVVLVRTGQVDRVKEVMPQIDELVKEDVLLSRSYEHQPQYIFTRLNDIKPEMIAEATREARKAAMQFAEDSGSTVGKIRSAQQGYFTIEDLDRYTPDIKRVRVVTTIEYYLLD